MEEKVWKEAIWKGRKDAWEGIDDCKITEQQDYDSCEELSAKPDYVYPHFNFFNKGCYASSADGKKMMYRCHCKVVIRGSERERMMLKQNAGQEYFDEIVYNDDDDEQFQQSYPYYYSWRNVFYPLMALFTFVLCCCAVFCGGFAGLLGYIIANTYTIRKPINNNMDGMMDNEDRI